MPKHKICDTNDSSSEDSDDERFEALVSEAVDPDLHKTLYEKENKHKSSEQKSQLQGRLNQYILYLVEVEMNKVYSFRCNFHLIIR